MTRQQANREILKLLSRAVEMYPEQQFNQLLINLNLGQHHDLHFDSYNQESVNTLERLKENPIIGEA